MLWRHRGRKGAKSSFYDAPGSYEFESEIIRLRFGPINPAIAFAARNEMRMRPKAKADQRGARPFAIRWRPVAIQYGDDSPTQGSDGGLPPDEIVDDHVGELVGDGDSHLFVRV